MSGVHSTLRQNTAGKMTRASRRHVFGYLPCFLSCAHTSKITSDTTLTSRYRECHNLPLSYLSVHPNKNKSKHDALNDYHIIADRVPTEGSRLTSSMKATRRLGKRRSSISISSALGSWFFFMRPYTWHATTYWNFCRTSSGI